MRNCKLFFCFLLLVAWACAEEGGVVDVTNLSKEYGRFPGIGRCFTDTNTDVSCVGVGEDRLMPHPDDCQLFYHCAGMWPLCKECPANLHFNPVEHVCDYPERAGCQIPS